MCGGGGQKKWVAFDASLPLGKEGKWLLFDDMQSNTGKASVGCASVGVHLPPSTRAVENESHPAWSHLWELNPELELHGLHGDRCSGHVGQFSVEIPL